MYCMIDDDNALLCCSPSICCSADHDDYLLYLQHILTRVHSTYYGAYDKFLKKEFENCPDLRGVVPFIRSEVGVELICGLLVLSCCVVNVVLWVSVMELYVLYSGYYVVAVM